ncbi:response regulator transcription factor [Peptostreptococcus porci]|uniref:Stage 0 sporulation protein A homolog n=1 Tax=Peptostreptococcus porci TaxID=2652282 RepID=A0A6N7X285_9FIRM|nr:response regulator transcription factor [Peptostreptococcus porci]MDD7182297.1 response regulator transcription factor [Peptostreptococcus porci]MDY2794104.1 response regulator transcription factor [Peptostreptococcus porci]MDY5435833.1 response regulator transcription factor [Peptostreptococcus porci]MDY5480543.1 response regulator transcription factor [Peptostreptococcus porci]MDY5963477.1 response regulator transcription factor [Peptostreptococcus porci]
MKKKILIVDDDLDIRESIKMIIDSEDYEIFLAGDAEEGTDIIEQNKDIDIIILDVMMPGKSGIQFCREVREKYTMPILFISARTSESDKIMGLSAGGDDYIVKPFSYTELLAKIKAILRRQYVYNGSQRRESYQIYEYHRYKDLLVNKDINEVLLNEKKVCCTEVEYRILLVMIENSPSCMSANEIYEKIWGELCHQYTSNSIMVHIRNLRIKLGDTGKKPEYIKTTWGKGYYIG